MKFNEISIFLLPCRSWFCIKIVKMPAGDFFSTHKLQTKLIFEIKIEVRVCMLFDNMGLDRKTTGITWAEYRNVPAEEIKAYIYYPVRFHVGYAFLDENQKALLSSITVTAGSGCRYRGN